MRDPKWGTVEQFFYGKHVRKLLLSGNRDPGDYVGKHRPDRNRRSFVLIQNRIRQEGVVW